ACDAERRTIIENRIDRLNATPCGSELVREGFIPDDTFLADVPAPSRTSPTARSQKLWHGRYSGIKKARPV
ncbi:hypothetical protein, partial [Pseudomonas syringae]|uniref:hypothetical protein n=1 Tax=Pseudomonas syringae TaxID=317 RepID=UPI001F15E687